MSRRTVNHFADTLISRVRELGHPLCIGLDPHLAKIPPVFAKGDMAPTSERTAKAVEEFLFTVLDRAAGRVAAVKPQIAFFEQLGHRGIETLTRIVDRARSLDLLVILDAKRGDIGSTADGYARAYLEPESPIEVDSITLNPYLGLDSLEPFAARCEAHARGMFVLVKTSNPGSGDLQNLAISDAPVFGAVASALRPMAERLEGKETGWSSLGVVVGATYPGEAQLVRERLPNSLFLVPGYGAQGGSAADAVSGFTPGPNGLEGGVVNSSRGILFPPAANTSQAPAWEQAVENAIDQAIDELGNAVAR